MAYIDFQATKPSVHRGEGRILLRELREFVKELHKSGRHPSPETPKVIVKKRKKRASQAKRSLEFMKYFGKRAPK